MARQLPGFDRFDLPSGARYLKIAHYADPAKDERWLEGVRQDMIDTPRDFRRQILMEEDVYDGEPVFPEYVDERHCPIRFRTEPLPVYSRSMFVGGWDCGQTLNPAFVLDQITEPPVQVLRIGEVVSEGGESMETFAPRVLRFCQLRIPGSWDEVMHVGDATVVQRSGSRGESAQEVARSILGKTIEPMTNVWAVRQSAMAWLLTQRLDEKAMLFLLDGLNCPTTRKGLLGAYHFETSARGDQAGAGRVLQMPLKNAYSHVQDAGQYSAIKVREIVNGLAETRVLTRR